MLSLVRAGEHFSHASYFHIAHSLITEICDTHPSFLQDTGSRNTLCGNKPFEEWQKVHSGLFEQLKNDGIGFIISQHTSQATF
jgi:hypothetical protein